MKKILLIILLSFGLQAESYEKLKTSCNEGDGENCTHLGILYQIGNGVNQSYEKAKIYYDKACTLNHAEGCSRVGDLYYFGQGVEQDNSQAKIYYTKACKLNYKEGCQNLQLLQEEEAIKEKQDELKRLKEENRELTNEAELLDQL